MKKQSQVLSQSLHSALLGFLSFATLTLILALFATLAHSADVTLAWDPNTEPDHVAKRGQKGSSLPLTLVLFFDRLAPCLGR